jgi:hypothetical protein
MDGNDGNDGNGSNDSNGAKRIKSALAASALLLLISGGALPAAEAPVPKALQAKPVLPAPDSLAMRIADRYGADAFSHVNSVHFVFNVNYKGRKIDREWTWFPKEDSVLYSGDDAKGVRLKAAYSRRNAYSMGSESVAAIDRSFINDQYWLLFPLHLRWDKDLKLQIAPGGKPGEAYHLTVMYPSTGGYTPGDAYDLFVDTTATIKRWIFRKGNSPQPTNEAFWSAPAKFDGLEISLEHPGPGKDFKLWFSDVKVAANP